MLKDLRLPREIVGGSRFDGGWVSPHQGLDILLLDSLVSPLLSPELGRSRLRDAP